jgi:hypothetical protein
VLGGRPMEDLVVVDRLVVLVGPAVKHSGTCSTNENWVQYYDLGECKLNLSTSVSR